MSFLFVQQSRVAGDALPLVELKDPGIGEAAEVFERLALVGALGVIGAGNNGGVRIHVDAGVFVGDQSSVVGRVFDIGQKLSLVHHGSVDIGVNELFANQAVEGFGVVIKLRLVPRVLECDQLAFVGAAGWKRDDHEQG